MSAAKLIVGALAMAALYGVVIGVLWRGQERLLFLPQVLPAEHRFERGADVHETWVDVPGARLHALHLRQPDVNAAKGVVFFLHGNAGSLQSWFVNLDGYRRRGWDLFIIDYRGYGKSSGRIQSQAQLQADVRAAWDRIAPAYAGCKRVIYGRSLGTGLAAQVEPDLTVLVSPYTSVVALAQEHYPWVPAAVLRYPLRTDAALAELKGPLLLVHGGRDTPIAPSHSWRLHAIRPQTELLIVPDVEERINSDPLSGVLAKRGAAFRSF